MRFFHPDAWYWILLAIPLVLLALWPFGQRRVEVSTLILWQRALARRTLWARWRGAVSWLLKLAAFGLLVGALAQPYWTSTRAKARSVVLILDASASMNATDVAPSRFAHAVKQAHLLIEFLRLYERMAIVSAGSVVHVRAGLTDNVQALHDALAAVRPTDGGNGVAEAIQLANDLLRDQPNPHVFVVTDGCLPPGVSAAKEIPLHWFVVGEKPENVGITRFEIRPSPAEPPQHELFVELANSSARPATGKLEFTFRDQPLPPVEFAIPVAEALRKTLLFDLSAGGLLTAKLDRDDHFQADNQASVLVPPRRRVAVNLIVKGESPLAAALQALPFAETTMAQEAPANASEAVTVYAGNIPETFLNGPALVVGPAGDCDLWIRRGDEKPPQRVAADAATRDLLLAGVDLTAVVVDEVVRLKFTQPAKVKTLATRADGEPLYSLLDRDSGPVLVWHTTLERQSTDLALRPEFPLLLANAVRWLGQVDDTFHPNTTTADVLHVPAAESPRTLRGPAGELPLPAERTTVGPLPNRGLWTLSSETSPHVVIAANLLNPRETNLNPSPEIQSETAKPVPQRGRELWWHFAGAALVLVCLDWAMHLRRFV